MGLIAEGKRSPRADVIETFAYAELPDSGLPDWVLWGGCASDESAAEPVSALGTKSRESLLAEFEQRLVEETWRSFESGRVQGLEHGLEQGRAAERASQGTAQQRVASQLERLVTSFAEERERYLHAVELEVVKLALAVAARILRREAQMDPLLLTGAVRVALGQLSASTSVRLRVPQGELDLWKESIALLPNLAVKPQVLPGDGMRLGDCVVETELGSVDLGVRAQLSEIERSFFDRGSGLPSTSLPSTAEMELAGTGRHL